MQVTSAIPRAPEIQTRQDLIPIKGCKVEEGWVEGNEIRCTDDGSLLLFLCEGGATRCFQSARGAEKIGFLSPGRILLLPPRYAQAVNIDGLVEGISIWISRQQLHVNLQMLDLPSVQFGPGQPRVFVDPLVERLIRQIALSNAEDNQEMRRVHGASLPILLLNVLNILNAQVTPDPDHAINRVVAYVEAHLDETLQADQLARVARMSKWHFVRVFKRQIGLSPHKYVLKRRLCKVKSMMRETDRALAEIAYECGFSSQSHMTVTFTRFEGISPGRYRSKLA